MDYYFYLACNLTGRLELVTWTQYSSQQRIQQTKVEKGMITR